MEGEGGDRLLPRELRMMGLVCCLNRPQLRGPEDDASAETKARRVAVEYGAKPEQEAEIV